MADTIHPLTVEGPNGDVVRMNIRGPAPDSGELAVDMLTERHTLGIFATGTYMKAMQQAGAVKVYLETPPDFVGEYGKPLLVGKVE